MTAARASGQCSNFGNCAIADARKSVEVMPGQDLVCPECGRALTPATQPQAQRSQAKLALGGCALALALLAAGGYALWRWRGDEPPAPQPQAAAVTPDKPASGSPPSQPAAANPPPATGATQSLRLTGSNTLGSALVPALAEAYLRRQGATSVRREPLGSAVETRVVGELPGGARAIEIRAHGTSTAFEALRSGNAEIAMASRRITSAGKRQSTGAGRHESAEPGARGGDRRRICDRSRRQPLERARRGAARGCLRR